MTSNLEKAVYQIGVVLGECERLTYQVAEKLVKPNYKQVTSWAIQYRKSGDKKSLNKFINVVSNRSPKYLRSLVIANKDDDTALQAIANCASQIGDDIFDVDDLKDFM